MPATPTDPVDSQESAPSVTTPLGRGASIAIGASATIVAIAAGFAVFCAGALVLVAIAFSLMQSQWWAVYVYDYGETDFWDSGGNLLDVYGHPPLGAWEWLGLALLIGAAYAVVVWGSWLIVWALAGVRGRERPGDLTRYHSRIAVRVLVRGIVVLSAYSLLILLWAWIEWWNALDGGLTLTGDPKPGPDPAFDPWQIPLGVVAFSAIGAGALLGLRALHRRAAPVRSEPESASTNRKASP